MIKKLAVILCVIVLSGCSFFVPVVPKFPNAPDMLKEECDPLTTLKDGAKLSDVMITITQNYMKYHECKRRNQGWREWYEDQKKIYEEATKK